MDVRKYCIVWVAGFEPAKSLAPKASALPNLATPRYKKKFICQSSVLRKERDSNPWADFYRPAV